MLGGARCRHRCLLRGGDHDRVKRLLGEDFGVDGTSISAWANHQSSTRKAGDSHASGDGVNVKVQARNNKTRKLNTDPDARLYRRRKIGNELGCLGQTLSAHRHAPT